MVTAYLLFQAEFPLPVLGVNLLSFTVAFFVSYFGHARVTFRRSGRADRFLLTSLSGLALNSLVVLVVTSITGWKFGAVAIGAISAPILVFLMSRSWVFGRQT